MTAEGQAADRFEEPLFRTVDGICSVTGWPITESDILRAIKRRPKVAGVHLSTRCHMFRRKGILTFLDSGETIENAQAIAANESPRPTYAYDRSGGKTPLDGIEKIIN
jgi:hypothetical protein